MSESVDGAAPAPAAWQPFTFGGVAAFSRDGFGRLLLVQFLCALIVSGSAVFFLHRAFVPVILGAIQKMPDAAKMTDGHLTGVDETLISETKFLAIVVSPETSDQIGQSADVQIQFRPTNFRVGSVFRPDWGWEFDYAPDLALNLSRSNLEPWWGAWNPIYLAGAGVAFVALLFVMWALLALIYTVPAKCAALFADRKLSWFGAWRMASAALLPGAILMAASTFLYGAWAVDLIGLSFLLVAHVLVGWIYVGGGVWACPRLQVNLLKRNPFNP
jgi:hypothetical protein